MRIDAPAKINLSLEITGRRPDGYHELVSVMQTVSLFDSLSVEPGADISVHVDGATLPEDNLVTRAATLLRRRLAQDSGAELTLTKRIPVAAGLGGGSSDAAATLIALSRYWDLRVEEEECVELAAQLGSDVPFFLRGGTALVEGRGERVTPLATPRLSWYVLANPGIHVLTASVYAELRHNEWTDGKRTKSLAGSIDPARPAGIGCNSLQRALFRICPEAERCLNTMAELAPGAAMVSGSGPTVFAQFSVQAEASGARDALRAGGYWAEIAHGTQPRQGSLPCV